MSEETQKTKRAGTKPIHNLVEVPAETSLTRYGVSCEHIIVKERDRGAAEKYPAFNGVSVADAQRMLLGEPSDGKTNEDQLREYLVAQLNTEALRVYTSLHTLDSVKPLLASYAVDESPENKAALENELLRLWIERMENPRARLANQTPEKQIAKIVTEMGKLRKEAKEVLTAEFKLADEDAYNAKAQELGKQLKALRDKKEEIEAQENNLLDELLGDL